MSIQAFEIILYVSDQSRSRDFYRVTLEIEPSLDVPGMTEFRLGEVTLGLMPEQGIRTLLGTAIRNPADASGIPRCELYLVVDDLEAYARRACAAGARLLSPLAKRDWGDDVLYLEDPDAHVLAFARTSAA